MRVEEKMKIIREFTSGPPPVQTIDLAKKLGLNVYYVDWPDDVSGRIQKDEKLGGSSGYAIFVNKRHHPNRRRFTIAHEIAHYVLHQDKIGDGVYDDALYRSGLPQKVEYEANKLAADILMPLDKIGDALDQEPASVEQLAEQFQVSKSAMSIRLGIPADD